MYSLEKREGIAVATLVTELMVPTKKSDLEYAVQTINTLFVYKVKILCYLFNSSNSSFL
ncbi:hypothetical protein BD560DRAFT_398375 [Blakeslea trispora]|nr:hypothetical protein BD560DRAFT_398375 [Blakeslea trispora]